jgi:hypothetical protein
MRNEEIGSYRTPCKEVAPDHLGEMVELGDRQRHPLTGEHQFARHSLGMNPELDIGPTVLELPEGDTQWVAMLLTRRLKEDRAASPCEFSRAVVTTFQLRRILPPAVAVRLLFR